MGSESYGKVFSPSLKQGIGKKISSSHSTSRNWITDFVFTCISMIPFTGMNKPIWLALLGWGLKNISGLASLMCRIKALSAGPMVKLSPSRTGMQECLVGAVMGGGGCSLRLWSLFGFAWPMSSEFYVLNFRCILQALAVFKSCILISKGKVWTAILY